VFENIGNMWAGLSGPKKIALVCGAIVIAILVIVLAIWLLKDEYDVLFSGLDTQDQATIVSELDKQKIPYRISEDGTAILVSKDSVHKTRLKVMSHGADIKGTVGFEIFNDSNFGASEFAQKINYQRALQGELARSITSIEEIKGARVHLVLPEGGLLRRKDAAPPKASVALTVNEGAKLSADQILGIQRLVAAAVPDLEPQAVVVSDQQGVTLSRTIQTGADGDNVSGKIEMKRQAEQYLTHKLADLLDKAVGPGQAIVSVDVTLNHDQINSSREDLLGAPGRNGDVTGMVTRERRSTAATPGEAASNRDDGGGSGAKPARGAESVEFDYAYGKKIEQVVGSPGGVKRLSVGVLLPATFDETKIAKIREIVAMAVGFNAQRGDGIAIQQIAASTKAETVVTQPGGLQMAVVPSIDLAPSAVHPTPVDVNGIMAASFLKALLVIVAALVVVWALFRRKRLSAVEREQMLRELQTWLDKSKKTTLGTVGS